MNTKAKHYIEKLQLKLHPEGGWFREVYRADETISSDHLPKRYGSARCFSTSIYFLLEGVQFSSFHKLKSDEQWHFYDGSPVIIYSINETGILETIKLGNNLADGEMFQTVIKRNTWFAAEIADKNSFALIGCTVAPGFEFDDFELAKRNELLKLYPKFKHIISKLTKT
ncbi:hypothetical protein BMS3Abin03_02162 [bacterium BMS3Abin03]|nr:hypothetical protein BMS3Abin03_02162 [bacterium BMS3Abin03]